MEGAVTALGAYLAMGVVLAVPLLWKGVGAIDPAARGAGLGFRLLILPGAIALWPVLLARWVAASKEAR